MRRIKDGCQTKYYEIIHTIEKLIKADEKIDFEYLCHTEIIIKYLLQVDEDGPRIIEKVSLINQVKKSAGL